MLSSLYRLRKSKDIERVLKSRLGAFDVVCGVKIAKNNLTHSRFAVVVGAKVSKKAVERNRIRRQYREIIRKLLPEIQTGYDVLLLASKPSLAATYEEKEKKLRSAMYRARLL